MLNLESTDNGELGLEAKAQINMFISLVRGWLPDFPKYYPKIQEQINNAQNQADEYLGNGEKIVVGFRQGKTMVLSIDAKKEFNFSYTPEKTLSKEQAIKQIEEYEAKIKNIKDCLAANTPVIIPEKREFSAVKDAILVNEGVRSFVENKVLGNSTIKYVLNYMKDEYNSKYINEQLPDENNGMRALQ